MKPEPEDDGGFGFTIVNITQALKVIKEQKPIKGEIDGHVWGKCKTENCLSWMQ